MPQAASPAASWRPVLLLSAAAFCWSTNYPIVRLAAAAIPAFTLSFWRWVVAALIVVGLAAPHWGRDLPLLLAQWKLCLFYGVVGVFIGNAFTYSALHYTTATNGLLMQSASPLLVILASVVLFRDRVSRVQLAGVAVSLAGVLVIASQGSFRALLHLRLNRGDLMIVAGLAAYAVYTAMLRLRPGVHALSLIACCFVIGAVSFLPFYGWEVAQGGQALPTPLLAALVLFLAVVPTILAFVLWNRGVELMGATRAGQFFHLIPVFGLAQAILLVDERLYPFHLAGIVLIGAGLALAARGAPRGAR